MENARKTPWLVLEGLNVLDFHEKHVAWFGTFDLERARKVVNLS